MWYIVHEVSLSIEENETLLKEKVAKKANVPQVAIKELVVVRKSLDARKKQNIVYKYSVAVSVADGMQLQNAQPYELMPKKPKVEEGSASLKHKIVVVGAGPAGLFAAYTLAKNGYAPILLERGKEIGARTKDFGLLQTQGVLNEQSNACFGEGGAGAFSDGKLTARNKNPLASDVFDVFIAHGAPEDIRYLAKPHLGTENVRSIVKNMRHSIIDSGGDVIFEAKFVGFTQKGDKIACVLFEKDEQRQSIDTDALVLATGHSARDTYKTLIDAGVVLEQKPFAMGVRIEHERAFIDERQYRKFAGHPALGAAEYVLKTQVENRGVYSFCMCPGGEVICSATEAGHTAVNGMSYYKRDGQFSNSALVVTVNKEDMGIGPLAGIELQRSIEHVAHNAAEGYGAVAQNYADFCKNQVVKANMATSYKPYIKEANLREILPRFIGDSLTIAAMQFDRAMPGFIEKGTLLGVETRTSSPVRILRDAQFETNIKGIYPAGEGAGYAGGILSSAIDGVRIANQIIETYKRP